MLVPFIPPNRMRQRAGCLNNGREKNLLESTATAFHASWFLKKKSLKHNEDRWKIWGPKPHRKPDPDAHRKHEPCQILWGLPSLAGRFGAHEHLLTDMVVPNKSVHFRCDPWNDKVFFPWLTSSFAIFHKETRKWPCVFINSFQFKYLI